MSRRLILASFVAVIAIGAPLVAWYFAARNEIVQEYWRYRVKAKLERDGHAAAIARRIAQRLELLRRIESRRGADEWTNLTSDDALITSSFDLSERAARAAPLLASVEPQVRALRVAASKNNVKPQSIRPRVPITANQAAPLNVMMNSIITMPPALNAMASSVITMPPALTGELVWRTIGNAITLLRPIARGRTIYVQGLTISMRDLAEEGSTLHRSEVTARPTTSGIAPIVGTAWIVSVNDRANIDSIDAAFAKNDAAFRRNFSIAASAGVLALIAIITMLWQSERLAAERARFAAAAAHELRTPLASLRLYGDMLAENLGDPARTADYAHHIRNEAERLGRVVTNVLHFARREKGSLTIQTESDDLGTAIEACITALRPAITSAGCDVRIAVEPELPRVAVDREALFHIAQNLLDNAERYSRTSSDRTIDVSVARANGGVALSVADRGPGMNGSRKRTFRSGLGLGLPLVETLSRAHGGRVAWKSRDGGGTVVTVMFPT